jgi:cytochrome c-type biogenesis protein CcmH/NrfG
VTDLNESLSYEPFDADTFALLGSCYTAQGKMNEAVTAFDRSIQIKPDCGPAHYGRAIMYEKLGMTDQAKKEKSAASKLGCTAEA